MKNIEVKFPTLKCSAGELLTKHKINYLKIGNKIYLEESLTDQQKEALRHDIRNATVANSTDPIEVNFLPIWITIIVTLAVAGLLIFL